LEVNASKKIAGPDQKGLHRLFSKERIFEIERNRYTQIKIFILSNHTTRIYTDSTIQGNVCSKNPYKYGMELGFKMLILLVNCQLRRAGFKLLILTQRFENN
jgi:hypothetical protein